MLVNNYTPTYITDWQESVLDKDLTAPPGSPTKGDRYIVGVVATGDWSGEDNNITEFNGSVWRFTTANEGMITWVEDENKYYIFDGSSWNVFGASLDHSKLTKLDYASAGHTGFLEDTIDIIKDSHIDWGTGTNQVSADDIPDGSTNAIITLTQETNFEDAYSKRVDTWGDGLSYSTQTASIDYNSTNLKITSNQIDTVQSIATGASPTFAGLTLTGFSGMLKTVAGVLTDAIADTDYQQPVTWGDGLAYSAPTVSVNVDDATIEINSDILRVKADGINDTHIDWGTGANQVSAADVPIADAGTYFTGTEVETALQEIYPYYSSTHITTSGATKVGLPSLDATPATVRTFVDGVSSSLYYDGGDITENSALDGTIDISEVSGAIKLTTTDETMASFTIAARVGMSLTADGKNTIVIDLNTDTPIFDSVTSEPNHSTVFSIGSVYREATTNYLHIVQGGHQFTDFQWKAHKRFIKVDGLIRASGFVTTESVAEALGIVRTSGVVYNGITEWSITSTFDSGNYYDITGVDQGNKKFTIAGDHTSNFDHGHFIAVHDSTGNDGCYTVISATAVSTNTEIVVSEAIPDATVDGHIHYHTFRYYYYDGDLGTPAWVELTSCAIALDDVYYNDVATGLVELTPNRYTVAWVYQDKDGHIFVVYGQGNYTEAQAGVVGPPASLPDIINKQCLLIAKITIQKNAGTFYNIYYPWTTTFNATSAADHAGLANLAYATSGHTGFLASDGSTPLTANWDVGNYTLTANGLTIDGTFTDGIASLVGGALTGLTNLTVDNLNLNGNTISSSSDDIIFDSTGNSIRPATTNEEDLGSSTIGFKDLYLSGDIKVAGWLVGWGYRKLITIDSGDIDSALTDFPVLVKVDNTRLPNAKLEDGTDAYDVVFTSNDGTTVLNHELVWYTNPDGEFWVQVPSISASTDTTVYMYYGKSGQSDTTTTDTWDAGFTMAQHFQTDGTDSTASNSDLTAVGATAGATGKIGDCYSFDGGDYLTLTDLTPWASDTQGAISAWTYQDVGDVEGMLMVFVDDDFTTGNGMGTWSNLTGAGGYVRTHLAYDGSQVWDSYAGDYSTGAWVHVMIVHDGTAAKIYVNGDYKTTASGSDATNWLKAVITDGTNHADRVVVGAQNWGGAYYTHLEGKIDELRVFSGSAPSAAWVKAEYESGRDDLVTYGSEETTPTGTETLSAELWDASTRTLTAGTFTDGTASLTSGAITGVTSLAMSGAIDMNSNLINEVTDPVSAQDAATKNYVDETIIVPYLMNGRNGFTILAYYMAAWLAPNVDASADIDSTVYVKTGGTFKVRVPFACSAANTGTVALTIYASSVTGSWNEINADAITGTFTGTTNTYIDSDETFVVSDNTRVGLMMHKGASSNTAGNMYVYSLELVRQ